MVYALPNKRDFIAKHDCTISIHSVYLIWYTLFLIREISSLSVIAPFLFSDAESIYSRRFLYMVSSSSYMVLVISISYFKSYTSIGLDAGYIRPAQRFSH